jgi:transposase
MTYYAGLDVSLEQTSVCVVDEAGVVVLERRVATEPAAIAAALAALPQAPARVLLETGGLTPWLWHELGGRGLVVHCIDARRAKAQLALRPAKTDRNDARGLAEIARMGWYANIRVKSLDHQALRAKLAARAQLVTIARDLGNQLRGLLRTFGLRVGKGKGQAFEQRVLALVADCAALQPVADGLLAARRAVLAEVERLDRVLLRDARADATCQRLMTASLAPSADVVSARSAKGVGAITALAYQSTIETPSRFRRASEVGAYVGLVPRRHQSGEIDRSGRISKQGAALLRGYLYEAATVLLSRLQRACALRDWGRALAARIGMKKARVAVARKLAVLLHHLWSHEEDFRWAAA